MCFKALHLLLCVALLAVVLTSVGCPPRKATLRVHNGSSLTIDEINIKLVTEQDWSDNLITSNIAPEDTRDITGIAAGEYNVRAISTTDLQTLPLNTFTLTAGQTFTWTIYDPPK